MITVSHEADGLTTVSMNVRPAGPIRKIVNVYEFIALVGGAPRPFKVFFPMDRRQARRYARRTGQRFRVHEGKMVWL